MIKYFISVVLGMFLVVPCTWAQQGSHGALSGIVKDATGAVVPGATVTATEQSTNVSSTAGTTAVGVYTFPSLPPGTYKISASHAGFRPAEIVDVPLRVAQLLNVDLTLQVGTGTETVTVSSDEQLIETGTAQLSHYVTTKEMEDWPLPVTDDGERQLQDFIFKSLPGSTGDTYAGSINGGQQYSNEIYIDGIAMGTFDTAELAPSVDAVGEFNLQAGTMGAQYNGGGTAVSNFNIHSGTNEFHGTLYNYFQNEDLNANSFDGSAYKSGRPKQRVNNFGATVGGPVRIPKLYDGRSKTFFFVSEEHTMKRNFTTSQQATLPTPDMLKGDFSAFFNPAETGDNRSGLPAYNIGQDGVTQVPVYDALGRQPIFGAIYDPSTTRVLTAGQIDPLTGLTATSNGMVREAFKNNQISTLRFDPVAQAYLKDLSFPTPVIANRVANNMPGYANNQPVFNQNVLSFKVDQVITDQHKLSFYMTDTVRKRYQAGLWSLPGTNPLDTWSIQDTPGKIVRVGEDWTVNRSMLNHFGMGYNRFDNLWTSDWYTQNWASKFGLQNLPSISFPMVSFSGIGAQSTFGSNANGSGTVDQSTIFTDQLSWVHGAHQLQFGTEWRFYNENKPNVNAQAAFSFNNYETADGNAVDGYTGNAFASFLLGQVDSTGRSIYNSNFYYRRREVGNFVQDNWKVNARLSLNLGLRWEVMTGISEKNGQIANLNINLPNPAAGNLPGALEWGTKVGRKSFENTDWGLILPRFGFAYSLNPKMTWRGGFGINTQSPEGDPALQQPYGGETNSLGYSGNLHADSSTNPQPSRDMAPFIFSQPYPTYTGTLPFYDQAQAMGAGGWPPQYINPNGAHVAYVENYNLGVQYDLGHQTLIEVNYLGNTSRRLYAWQTDTLNQLPIGDLSYGDKLLDPLYLHPEIRTPYAGFNTNWGVNQALAPFPQYGGGDHLNEYDSHNGWSRYDSMQATLTRHVGHGFSFLTSYTWSKTMTNTNVSSTGVQDVHNLKAEKAPARNINLPQQLKFTGIYDLPVGSGQLLNVHGVLDWIVGGWTLSPNLIYQSGDMLSIWDSGPQNGIFASTRPNYTGQKVKLNQPGTINVLSWTGPQYLNPAAFKHVQTSCDLVQQGQACNNVALATGNVPNILGNVFGPGLADENLSLQKNFHFGEKRYYQIRADAMNMFNRAGRGDPVTDVNNVTSFGKITNPGTDSHNGDGDSFFYHPRVLQIAMRINF